MTIQLFSPPTGMECTHKECGTSAIVHIRIERFAPQPMMPLNALLCPAHFLLWASEFETWELERHPAAFGEGEMVAR